MHQLQQFIALAITAHHNGVSVAALRATLCAEMEEEELTLLLEVVVLEAKPLGKTIDMVEG